MTAWTDAIDVQLDALDDQVIAETAQRVFIEAQLIFAEGQRAAELQRALDMLDEVAAERMQWRAVLIEARALGYLPDPRSRFYNEDLGGFLQ